jgi:hypothetical protein
VLCAELCQHLRHDRLQLRQVNSRDFPKLLVVEALVFVPQDISNPDNGVPRRIYLARKSGGNAFAASETICTARSIRASMHVAALVLHKRKASNDRGDTLDLIANMKQMGARGGSCWQPSKNPHCYFPMPPCPP